MVWLVGFDHSLLSHHNHHVLHPIIHALARTWTELSPVIRERAINTLAKIIKCSHYRLAGSSYQGEVVRARPAGGRSNSSGVDTGPLRLPRNAAS